MAQRTPSKENASWIGSWLTPNEWRLFRSPAQDEKIIPPDPTPSIVQKSNSKIKETLIKETLNEDTQDKLNAKTQ